MGFNSVGNYNNSFIGNSSAKPICGQFLTDLFKFKLNEAKVDTTALLVPGAAITVVNAQRDNFKAGSDLNPNVLSITGEANSTVFNGFLLESPTDVLADNATAAGPVAGQIVNVGLFGSGVEVYLPCNANVSGISLNTAVYWDVTNKEITATQPTGGTALPVKLLSPVVDGIKYVVTNSVAGFANTKCIKVQL